MSQDEQVRMVPVSYPDFADANYLREWDGSREAEAWAELMDYRAQSILVTVRVLTKHFPQEIDLFGVLATLWGTEEEEIQRILDEASGQQTFDFS
jgi:hypothetical protein